MARAKLDFLSNSRDLDVLIYGELGFSTAFIMEQTGLEKGPVYYRLQRAGVRRNDYRNGTSAVAKAVLRSHLGLAKREAVKQVRRVRRVHVLPQAKAA